MSACVAVVHDGAIPDTHFDYVATRLDTGRPGVPHDVDPGSGSSGIGGIAVVALVEDAVGDTAAALKSYQKALELRRELAASGQREEKLRLAGLYDRIGDVQTESGELEQAKEIYWDALEIRQELNDASPGDLAAS